MGLHYQLGLVEIRAPQKSTAFVSPCVAGSVDSFVSDDPRFQDRAETVEVFQGHGVVPGFRNLAHEESHVYLCTLQTCLSQNLNLKLE